MAGLHCVLHWRKLTLISRGCLLSTTHLLTQPTTNACTSAIPTVELPRWDHGLIFGTNVSLQNFKNLNMCLHLNSRPFWKAVLFKLEGNCKANPSVSDIATWGLRIVILIITGKMMEEKRLECKNQMFLRTVCERYWIKIKVIVFLVSVHLTQWVIPPGTGNQGEWMLGCTKDHVSIMSSGGGSSC